MKPQAGHTVPEDIPPVHVLEAAQNQDRQETEDLLAGFDRPGRGPKKPSPERDFVDYYAKKKGGRDSGRGPSSGPPAVVAPRQREISTVVKPRKTTGMPAWVAWAGAALLMLGLGGGVAFLATGEPHPSAGKPTGPGAATTITAATTSIPASRDLVPPPAPAEPTTTTTTPMTVTEPPPAATDPAPRATGRRDPRSAPSASAATGNATTAPNAAPKPAPRDDFIRDL